MADSAIFKKPKSRPSRLRNEAVTNDAEESSDASASALAAKVRKQHKERIKPKAKLSFGGDEVSISLHTPVNRTGLSMCRGKDVDGEVFEVKKKFSKKLNLGSNLSSRSVTSLSVRIYRANNRIFFSLVNEMIEQVQAPSQTSVVYSKEYLSELRAGTMSTPSRDHSPRPNYDSDLVFDESEMAGAVIVDQDTPMGEWLVIWKTRLG